MAKSKLTPERHEKIVQLIRGGNYASTSAKAAGLSEKTYYNYLERGEAAQGKIEAFEEATQRWEGMSYEEQGLHPELNPSVLSQPSEDDYAYFQFLQDIKKAQAEAEAAAVLQIQQAGQKNWTALAWLLERRSPEKFGKREKITHEGEVGHTHALLPTSPQAIAQAKRQLEQAREIEAEEPIALEPPVDLDAEEEA